MISETVINLVDQYGYLLFFLAFSLGPFGIPVPNEITILTGGILANEGILNPWIMYVCILGGLLTAVTIAYLLGKLCSNRILMALTKSGHLQRAENLFKRYGDLAICLAFFIPLVRYIVPVFAGISGVKYKKFALLSYVSAMSWTALFLSIGTAFGEQLSQLVSVINFKTLAIIILIATTILTLIKKRKRTKKLLLEQKEYLRKI